MAPFEFKST